MAPRRIARKPWRPFLVWAAGVAAGVLAALIAPAVHDLLTSDPKSIPRQIDDLRRAEARSGRVVTVVRKLQLHPPTTSYLVVTRPEDEEDGGRPPVSDEVAVYDLVGRSLERRYAFRPRPDSRVDASGRSTFAYRYVLISASDIDDDGAGEVIGSWASFRGAGPVRLDDPLDRLHRPSALVWADGDATYRQVALLERRPKGLEFGARSDKTRQRISAYRTRSELESEPVPQAGAPITGYAAEEVTIVDGRSPPLLLAGMVVKGTRRIIEFNQHGGISVKLPRTVVVEMTSLDFVGGGRIELGFCPMVELNLLGGVVRTDQPVTAALLRSTYRRYRRYVDC